MYLTDTEIRALLAEMEIAEGTEEPRFDPDEQIQPCSIDLHISNVFWRPSRRQRAWRRLPGNRRRYAVDLRHAHAHDLDPLRDWKRVELGAGDVLTIGPGEVLMGRIHERFRIPPSCAGKIEGRSSFARLGLSVHCTGDFINPGWSGFMPLQLFNAGPYPIRITPHLSICQLMLVPLSGEPERSYGDQELRSKYVNDDGGPSLWWRDHSLRELQNRLGEVHASERIQREVIQRVRFRDPDVLERFQDFVAARRVGELENAGALLDQFADAEDRRRLMDRVAIGWLPVILAGDIGSLFVELGPLHVALAIITLTSLLLAWRAYLRRDAGYLGHSELREGK